MLGRCSDALQYGDPTLSIALRGSNNVWRCSLESGRTKPLACRPVLCHVLPLDKSQDHLCHSRTT
eukprot:6710928-Alexandrium_andersonii.AAC.1